MASFTDRSPATFTPYIPQKPVEAMVSVGMDREQKYGIGVQRVQEQINSISALSNNLLRPQAKEYLSSKLNSVVNDINANVGDLSNANVFTALMSKAIDVGQDQKLNIELQNSLQASNKMRQIEDLKEKDPKLYSQFNEEYAMEDIHKWMTSDTPVGSSFVDTKPFSPYYDYNQEMQGAIEQFLKNQDVQQIIDPNTGLVTQIKGKSPLQMKEYLSSVLSEKAKQQMRIEGHVMGNRLSDQSILELYNSGIDDEIRTETNRNNDLQKKSHSSSANMTQEEKDAVIFEIQNSNKSIAQLNNAKTDSNRIASILANKGDFYGEMFMNNTITRLAYSSAPSSVTYETNQAIVKQIDRAFDAKMEQYRQSQQNMRASMDNQLGWARLNQERELKLLDLEDKQDARLNKINPGRGSGGVLGSSYLGQSPNETLVPTAKTPSTTRDEKDSQGYERFTSETNNLYRSYGADKFNVMKQLMSDPVTRREIANSMGVTSDQALSAYVAAPVAEEANIYSKFMMMNPTVTNSINNYLEAKNEQWMKGQRVNKTLDTFFSNTSKTKANIDARENFDNLEKEALKSQLSGLGINSVRVGGLNITPDDMIEYATTGNNYKINQTRAERATEITSSVGGGIMGGMTIPKTISSVEIDPVIMGNINRIKQSQAFVEYKNKFNESFGPEGMVSAFNFDLTDKKDKLSKQEFNSYASQIATLWNDDKRGRQISTEEVNPNFLVDRTTGEVTFGYSYKDANNKTITSTNNKIVVPTLKSSLIDSDREFSQMLFYGRGATPLLHIKGSKPLKASIVSTSDDPKSQYTVNGDGTPAKYFVKFDNGDIAKDPLGGFNSPSEALNWIEDFNQTSIDDKVKNTYIQLLSNPQFNSLPLYEKSKLMDQYIENIDPKHNIQVLSNNRTMNMLRDIEANLAQQNQNQRR